MRHAGGLILGVAVVVAALCWNRTVTFCWATPEPDSVGARLLWLETDGQEVRGELLDSGRIRQLAGMSGPDGRGEWVETALLGVKAPRAHFGFSLEGSSAPTRVTLLLGPDEVRKVLATERYVVDGPRDPDPSRDTFVLACDREPAGWRELAGAVSDGFEAMLDHLGFGLLLGFGLWSGLLFSLEEAWFSKRGRPRLARLAFTARVGLTVAMPALVYSLARVGHLGPLIAGVALRDLFGRYLVPASALWFGQVFAAGVVAHRRRDLPDGLLRHSPGLRYVLGTIAASGLALLVLGHEVTRMAPLGVPRPLFMTVLWALAYVSVPLLVWLALPAAAQKRVRLAGLAIVLFALGQVLVGSEGAMRRLNVFAAEWSWSSIRGVDPGRLDAEVWTWASVSLVLAATAYALGGTARQAEASGRDVGD